MAVLSISARSVRFMATATCAIVLALVTDSPAQGQTAHLVGGENSTSIGTQTRPSGVAVDAAGNVYVVDSANNSLSELTPSGNVFPEGSFLSGDGSPYGIAADTAGNLFITDNVKSDVAKETLQPGGYYSLR